MPRDSLPGHTEQLSDLGLIQALRLQAFDDGEG
jgi:hypothetical protein